MAGEISKYISRIFYYYYFFLSWKICAQCTQQCVKCKQEGSEKEKEKKFFDCTRNYLRLFPQFDLSARTQGSNMMSGSTVWVRELVEAQSAHRGLIKWLPQQSKYRENQKKFRWLLVASDLHTLLSSQFTLQGVINHKIRFSLFFYAFMYCRARDVRIPAPSHSFKTN